MCASNNARQWHFYRSVFYFLIQNRQFRGWLYFSALLLLRFSPFDRSRTLEVDSSRMSSYWTVAFKGQASAIYFENCDSRYEFCSSRWKENNMNEARSGVNLLLTRIVSQVWIASSQHLPTQSMSFRSNKSLLQNLCCVRKWGIRALSFCLVIIVKWALSWAAKSDTRLSTTSLHISASSTPSSHYSRMIRARWPVSIFYMILHLYPSGECLGTKRSPIAAFQSLYYCTAVSIDVSLAKKSARITFLKSESSESVLVAEINIPYARKRFLTAFVSNMTFLSATECYKRVTIYLDRSHSDSLYCFSIWRWLREVNDI